MKRWIAVALLGCATLAHAQTPPAKKELVAKLLQLQQPGIEIIARQIVERPAAQLMQQAGNLLQTQVPPDKREAIAKSIESDVKSYVDDAMPIVRDRAIKLAPSTMGALLEAKFSEDELKQLIAWFDAPVAKKYHQLGGELQTSLGQKLISEAPTMLDPKLAVLQQKVRAAFGIAPPGAASGPGSAAARSKPAASAAKSAASTVKPAAKAASK